MLSNEQHFQFLKELQGPQHFQVSHNAHRNPTLNILAQMYNLLSHVFLNTACKMISGNIKNMEIESFSLNIFLMKKKQLKGNPCGEFGSFLPFPVFQGELLPFVSAAYTTKTIVLAPVQNILQPSAGEMTSLPCKRIRC